MYRNRVWWLVAALLAAGCASEDASEGGTAAEPLYSMADKSVLAPINLAPTTVEPEDVLLVGGTVMPVSGPPIEGGWVLIQGGRITEVGQGESEAPEGVEVIDVTGKFVTPGIIDTHSHLGVYAAPSNRAHSDGNEMTSPTTPHVDAQHSVWPQDPGFFRALAGGVTTLMVIPGSGNLIGGRGTTLKTHPGISSRAMRFPGAPVGLKMACGENPKRVYGGKGRLPSTRMGSMALWRKTFQEAVEYGRAQQKFKRSWKKWEAKPGRKADKEPKPPKRDLKMETLVSVLDGDILVHVHCYRADEMLQVLQLAHEFGFRVRSFHHAVEAYKIRDVLAEWDVSVSTWADWWGFKIEAHDAILQNAALVSAAGGRAIIHSDSAEGIQRLNQEASKAYHAGLEAGLELTETEALRWITLNPAWALGVDDQTGSLEAGKMADVVVWSKHPLSVYAKAELVFVDGVREFDIKASKPWSDFEVYQIPEVTP